MAGGRGTGRRGDARLARSGARRRGSRARSDAINGRIRLLRILCVVFFVLAFGRALALASGSSSLTAMAQQQQVRRIDLPAHRGAILDRSGQELAVGQPAQTVFATPYLLKDPTAAAAALARVLKITRPIDVSALIHRLSDHKSGFAFVARKINPQLAARALKAKAGGQPIPGVGSYAEEARVYPMGTLATQLLGIAGMDNTGLAGLELKYNRQLAGKAGNEVVVQDPAGRSLRTLASKQPVAGQDIRLTIDQDIQYTAEAVLAGTVKRFHAKGATAIVMNPRTGEIYAMANAPLVKATAFGSAGRNALNRAVVNAYEPGSIFKAVTVSAALSEHVVTPGTKFRLPPTLRVYDRVIHEAHPRGAVTYTVDDIVTYSSNVGAVKIGQKLGEARLIKWMKAFGLGRKTGIDFPGEIGGLVPAADQWSPSTIGNVPMGQGVAVTPLQMADVYATVANDGVHVQPHLVAQVGTRAVKPARGQRVIPARVAHQVMAMLTNVVDKGTGKSAQIPGYLVAGKTGTAEKPLPNGTGYSKTAYVASFVGIVPAQNPQLLVLVMVDEPHPIWGATVAAPAVRQIATFALQHLEIAP
jgi:cell division protein FtsI (penicillin-binding protein 3)